MSTGGIIHRFHLLNVCIVRRARELRTDTFDEVNVEQIRSKYRAYLGRLLSGSDPADPYATEKAYAALREAHERLMEKNPHIAENGREREFREAMEVVIQEHAIPPQPETMPRDSHSSTNETSPISKYSALFAGFVAGALLVAFAGLLLTTFNVVVFFTGDAAARAVLFEEDFQQSVGQLEVVGKFLKKVEAEIINRQKENPVSINELAGKKIISLAVFDEALNAEAPKGLPTGTAFIVRATEKAYKVAATGPLCRAAAVNMPELVDPRHTRYGVNCLRFGYWNEAGSRF